MSDVNISVEVGANRKVLVVLDRRTECVLMPWQQAFEFAKAIEGAVKEVRRETDLFDPPSLLREQEQIKLNTHEGKVALLFEWGDRIEYSWRTAEVLAQAVRIKAQDVQYAKKFKLMPTMTLEQAKKAIIKR